MQSEDIGPLSQSFLLHRSALGLFKVDFWDQIKGQLNYLDMNLNQIKGQIKYLGLSLNFYHIKGFIKYLGST